MSRSWRYSATVKDCCIWHPSGRDDAPVLLALHGIGSRAEGWGRLAACLPDWRLIALDLPGYGITEPLPQAWPLAADYADLVAAFVDGELNEAPLHVVGHSLGTLVGAALAADYPDLVASLTLAACAQGGGVARGAPLPAAHQARIDDLARLGARDFAAARAPRLFHHAPPDVVAEAERHMATVTLPGYAQAVRMLASGDLAADCARIKAPTAVIVGAEDTVTPPAQSARAHAALSNPGAFVTVPGCGHALPLQAPQALADLIRSHTRNGARP